MAGEGSTTNYARHPRSSRWAREAILDAMGAYSRMDSSATDSFWRGRISRVYLTSALWNLQRWRIFAAMGRLSLFFVATIRGGTSLFRKDFWQAVINPYASITFEKGRQEANRKKSLET